MRNPLIAELLAEALGTFLLVLCGTGVVAMVVLFGQGTAGAGDWQRFVHHAYQLGMDSVSVWRYGTTNSEVWPTLHRMAPPQPAAPQVAAPAPEPAVQSQPETVAPAAVAPAATAVPTTAAASAPQTGATYSGFGFNTTTTTTTKSSALETSDPCKTP